MHILAQGHKRNKPEGVSKEIWHQTLWQIAQSISFAHLPIHAIRPAELPPGSGFKVLTHPRCQPEGVRLRDRLFMVGLLCRDAACCVSTPPSGFERAGDSFAMTNRR